MPRDFRLSQLAELAESLGAQVEVSLIPRGEPFLTDHVYSLTARLYCSCGVATHFTAAWQTVVTKVCEFWGEHSGEGHGPTTPELARRARRRRG